MKKFFSVALRALALAVVIFQLSSCEKENIPAAPIATSIQGLWVGTYSINGQTALGTQYYAFVIKPDGTMINESKYTGQQHLNVGPWSLSGDTLSCRFTCVYGYQQNVGITETATAKFDKEAKTLVGTWRNIPPLSGSGPFILTKVE